LLFSVPHPVLGEYGTTTWCVYCPYAHAALKQIYAEGSYPFYYVSLIQDKNTHASTRVLTDYNCAGYPTVWFDGGYRVDVGAYTSVPQMVSWYRSTIISCGNRAVPNINASLSVQWLGNAQMNITVTVKNNEASTYNGRIRVYVTEKTSSMGWNDHNGNPYTFPFLDYAFNEVISVTAGGTWQDSIIWDGHNYNDGHGHNFGSITMNNIMVIAAVFNAQWHQGYSDTPPNNPFDAYYVDETTAATPTIPWIRGDVNNDGTINSADVVYLINYLFIGGPEPQPVVDSGDCNHDGIVNSSDVVYLINYLFINGPAPPP